MPVLADTSRKVTKNHAKWLRNRAWHLVPTLYNTGCHHYLYRQKINHKNNENFACLKAWGIRSDPSWFKRDAQKQNVRDILKQGARAATPLLHAQPSALASEPPLNKCQFHPHGVTKSRTRPSDFPFPFHFHALEKEMATHSSVLAWRIPGKGESGGLPSMGSHRLGHNWSDLAAAAAILLLLFLLFLPSLIDPQL